MITAKMRRTGLHSASKLSVSQSLVSEIRYRLTPDIKKYDTADTQEETLNKNYIQVTQLLETEGAPEVADSGGPPAHGRWSGGASPPLPPSP